MILPQPDGGTPLYLPPLHSTPAAAISPYTHIPQQAVTAALHQQFHQTGAVSCLTPAVVGQITPVNVSVNNTNPQSHSTPSVMAAAAAMAAAVQWPQNPAQNNQQNQQQSSTVTVTHSVSHVNNEHSINQTSTITQNQSAVAAQHPTSWHWSTGVQQSQNTVQETNPQSNMFTIDTSSSIGATKSTSSISNPNLQFPQQVSNSTLSLYPSSFGDLSSTLQLLQSSTLTASTAALLAATVMHQPNTNIFDNEINMNLDMTTVATLAALATASINSPSLINTNMNSIKEMKTKEKEDITTSEFSKSVHLNDDMVGLPFTQPIKKPRYDVETVQKIKKDE